MLLTVKEVRERLDNRVSLQQLDDLCKEGAIESVRVGRKILVPETALEAYLNRGAAAPT